MKLVIMSPGSSQYRLPLATSSQKINLVTYFTAAERTKIISGRYQTMYNNLGQNQIKNK